MRVAVFSARRYDQSLLTEANHANPAAGHELLFIQDRLTAETAALARGCAAVCVFVNDCVDAEVLQLLADQGTRLVATRSTGYNHIDAAAAGRLGVAVVRVSDYSPHSVAEFAVGLLLAVNRKIARASMRTREGNFELDGLMGFDLHGKTVGVIGTGKIGSLFARIMLGFGCTVLGHDKYPDPAFEQQGGRYVPVRELLAGSDVISLHCPLTEETHHIVDAASLSHIKRGAILVNTSRGGLVDTEAAVQALKSGQLGGLAIDVYEQEASLFFQDLSSTIITDDVIQRLVSFPNVIVTGHQAFFTVEAIGQIMAATVDSITDFERGAPLLNRVPGN
ncbi:2-hydroxyacid dehydrogenase [Comamonas resistens]|uniref:2-hydroxyacid dehydrogenase n=1 Tax=Comamonas resistens TaxID=3046670 RepID=A0ABY8SPT9_9BURK|nr:2-hydroxyacid dehydrogenase [Comamonas resistens]MDL5035669.1 2-hydroxyacid dehydrogenase [Comamonas resistens]WHS65087.1 2-hydroxyacid dehydrogenase [Comamonas resistens]